ncbi:ChaN family lipoprotein [bacterium]|nr:ChaN family lipoprotein [bacterium]
MQFFKPHILFIAVIFLLSIQGCAGVKKPPVQTLAIVPGVSGHFKIGQIMDLTAGISVSFDKLADQLSSKDLVFVGEVHDNPEHHLIQVQILQAIISRHSEVTLAMEFFQQTAQKAIDRYLQGDTDEETFLKEVGWKKGGGFEYSFYRPLMLLAKQNGIGVLALNAPRDIVKKVARKGLKGLDEHERKQLPEEIDLTNAAHREYVREAYGQHGHGNLKTFEFFYEAQCVWEDTMAHNIAEYLRRSNRKVIAFMGNGHIVDKFGVPNRTIKRVPVSMTTVMPYALRGQDTIEKGTADYVWLTPAYPHRFMLLRQE